MALGARTWYPAQDERHGEYQLQKAEERAIREHEDRLRRIDRLREMRLRRESYHGTPLGAAHNFVPRSFHHGAGHHPLCNAAGGKAFDSHSLPRIGMTIPAPQMGAQGHGNNGQLAKQMGQLNSNVQHNHSMPGFAQGQNKGQQPNNLGSLPSNQNGNQQKQNGGPQKFGNQQSSNQQGFENQQNGNKQQSNQSGSGNQQNGYQQNGAPQEFGNQQSSNQHGFENQKNGNKQHSNQSGSGNQQNGHQNFGNQQHSNQQGVGNHQNGNPQRLNQPNGNSQSFGNQQAQAKKQNGDQQSFGNQQNLGAQQKGFPLTQNNGGRQGGEVSHQSHSKQCDHLCTHNPQSHHSFIHLQSMHGSPRGESYLGPRVSREKTYNDGGDRWSGLFDYASNYGIRRSSFCSF
ncbi:hypothetical protein CROQUDRAFT_652983 [Cronartium quercuum f. sp. fusiforme G11]|uniref:Uncharacterized protein n=1 Tax=Cronartium quercuum f. sp. fusiforme G11 TaxID=708437 RepID=A0A9P6NUX0_9BASI|nr:hypothetical protein CROQUDRAFT_652983 [Cronartium quercuum f. sp. fusiforme G11]